MVVEKFLNGSMKNTKEWVGIFISAQKKEDLWGLYLNSHNGSVDLLVYTYILF